MMQQMSTEVEFKSKSSDQKEKQREFRRRIEEKGLTKESKFADVAQVVAEVYYLTPYPGKQDVRPNKANRKYHGATHASSATLIGRLSYELYKEYKPEVLKTNNGLELDDEYITLSFFAIFYHDSANTSEIAGDPEEQAANFTDGMLALGFTPSKVKWVAQALNDKDNPKKNTSFICRLINSADCLDIIRVKKLNFDKNYLLILEDLKEIPAAVEEINHIITNHHQTLKIIYKKKVHKFCELAENCYSAVEDLQVKLLEDHIVLECLKQGKMISVADIPSHTFTFRDIYNPEHSLHVKAIIAQLVTVKETKEVADSLMASLKDRCFIRTIGNSLVEFEQLKGNQRILEEKNLTDEYEIKAYMARHGKISDKLVWKPCSLLLKNIPMSVFRSNFRIAVLINSNAFATMIYFYKGNVFSNAIASNEFTYEPVSGGSKNRTFSELQSKFVDMHQRKIGKKRDGTLHYFGRNKLKHNEVLGTYKPEHIEGIVVPSPDKITTKDKKEAAKQALLLKARLGRPWRTFYQDNPFIGLMPVSDEEIIKQSGIRINETTSYLEISPYERVTLFDIYKEEMQDEKIAWPKFNIKNVTLIRRPTDTEEDFNLYPEQFVCIEEKTETFCIVGIHKKDDRPVFKVGSKLIPIVEPDLVRNVAIEYYALAVEKLNKALEEKDISEILERNGIKKLNVGLIEYKDKYKLNLKFQAVNCNNNKAIINNLVKLLGLPAKTEQGVLADDDSITLIVPDIQKVDDILLRIKAAKASEYIFPPFDQSSSSCSFSSSSSSSSCESYDSSSYSGVTRAIMSSSISSKSDEKKEDLNPIINENINENTSEFSVDNLTSAPVSGNSDKLISQSQPLEEIETKSWFGTWNTLSFSKKCLYVLLNLMIFAVAVALILTGVGALAGVGLVIALSAELASSISISFGLLVVVGSIWSYQQSLGLANKIAAGICFIAGLMLFCTGVGAISTPILLLTSHMLWTGVGMAVGFFALVSNFKFAMSTYIKDIRDCGSLYFSNVLNLPAAVYDGDKEDHFHITFGTHYLNNQETLLTTDSDPLLAIKTSSEEVIPNHGGAYEKRI